MFREPRGLTHELRRMNLYGILGHYLPAFGRIVGQMQHDLFHVYTVDEHILMVIRNLRRFTEAQHAHEYPLCSRLMADFERREVLYLAGLFHDIAKGRGGDHSTLGARDARRFCRAHGLPREDGELVAWLVARAPHDVGDGAEAGHHRSRRRRGIREEGRHRAPAVGALPAHRRRHPRHEPEGVERVEGASCSRTSSTRRAARLAGEARRARSRTACSAAGRRRAACCGSTRCRTAPSGRCGAARQPSISSATRAEEIAWHARHLYWRVERTRPVVKARLARAGAGLQVLVYLPDQKDLFARICGFFGRAGLSILEAKIHTTRHGYALDTFAVHDPANPNASYRDTIQLIEFELTRVLRDSAAARAAGRGPREPAAASISRCRPRCRSFPTTRARTTSWRSSPATGRACWRRSPTRWRSANINVVSAKINTLGERAEDVFLIDGARLHDEQALLRLETAVRAAARLTRRDSLAGVDVGRVGEQDVGEAELAQVAHAHRIEDAVAGGRTRAGRRARGSPTLRARSARPCGSKPS